MQAAPGEVVRLYLVNTANTRIFNFGVRGAQMKLVGGDSGRYEHETFVDEVLCRPRSAPSVDVLFDAREKLPRAPHTGPDLNLGGSRSQAPPVGNAAADVRRATRRSRAHC